MNRRTRTMLGLLSTAAVLALSPQTHAQSASAGDESASEGGREIVVTAQKREQLASEVPMSISAVGAAEIAARGASAIEDMQASIPGLAITQYSPGQQRATLRGVSVYSGLPTVGVYLDEVPLNIEMAQAGVDVRLIDMQRIEVLRGPQGTLYGQGAMGGTIRYITNDPDLHKVTGLANGEIAGVHRGGTDWQANGAVSVPIVSDTLAVRIAGGYQKFGGWVDNTALGKKDINSGDTWIARAKVLWQPTNALRVTALYSHQDLNLGANNSSDRSYQIAEAVPSAYTQRADIANLTASYDLGRATLFSSTSYLDRLDTTSNDISALYVPLLTAALGLPTGLLQSLSLAGDVKSTVFNQEIRLASDGEGPLNWTFGGVYRDGKTRLVTRSELVPDVLPIPFIVSDSNNKSKSWAVFGELTYRITPAIEATLGGRYFEDRRGFVSDAASLGTPALDVGRKTFHAFSPRFNVLWKAADGLNLYANVAKGFRSGGFNNTSAGLGIVTVPPTFEPETLWSYELGAKFHSDDRRFDGQVALYRNEWSDAQSVALAPGSLINYTSNGGKLAGWGVDAQASLRPLDGLTLSASAGWNDMKYKSATADHQPGDPADYVPRFTGSASAEYRFAWSEMLPGIVRVDFQHTDRYQIFIRNGQLAPARTQANDQLGARIGIDHDRWSVVLFGRNLLGDRAIVAPAFGALLVPVRAQPRTVGVAGSVRF